MSTLHGAVVGMARRPAFERVVEVLERLDRGPPRVLCVLTYHRVDEVEHGSGLDPALISATPGEFERQVAWLAANRTALSLEDLLRIRRGAVPMPPRPLLVTFDDAYRDFASNAWPVLRRHGIPATLFVPTAYPDRDTHFWWDRLHCAFARTARRDALDTPAGLLALGSPEQRSTAVARLRAWVSSAPHGDAMIVVDRVVAELGGAQLESAVLGWDGLRALAADGVALAPHSRTHARLDRVADDRARDELTGSRADLVRETGRCPPAFAFPGGGHDERSLRLLAREGFEIGFTTRRGGNDIHEADWLRLRRTNVGRRASLPLLRAQLVAWPARTIAIGT